MNETLQEQLARLRLKAQPGDGQTKSVPEQGKAPLLIPRTGGSNRVEKLLSVQAELKKIINNQRLETQRKQDSNEKAIAKLIEDVNSLTSDIRLEAAKTDQKAERVLFLESQLAMRPAEGAIEAMQKEVRAIAKREAALEKDNAKLAALQQKLKDAENSFKTKLARLTRLDKEVTKVNADREVLREVNRQQVITQSELTASLRKQKLEHKRITTEAAALRLAELQIAKQNERLTNRMKKFARDSKNTALSDGRMTDASVSIARVLSKRPTSQSTEFFIRSFETVHWLASRFDDPHELVVPKKILLIGDGPWPTQDFTTLLTNLGFEVYYDGYAPDVEVTVVGRENWSEANLNAQIDARANATLRVYPQELFLLLLAIQADPFEVAPHADLRRFVADHPVFEYLFEQSLPWPESNHEEGAPIGLGDEFEGASKISPLFKLNYTVAQNKGLTSTQRRSILDRAFSAEQLEWCNSDEYMRSWGEPNSRRRLRRIAWHLYFMSKLLGHHLDAVSKWRSDLAWLKKKHYRTTHRFSWPD